MIVYLDHNSTTKPHPQVIEAFLEIVKKPYNNSSTHQLGRYADSLIRDSKRVIQDLLNAHNYEIIFTSGATESANQVIFSSPQEKLFYSTIEHACIDGSRPINKKIEYFNCHENGIIDLEDLNKKIANNKDFIAFAMLANNETGAIQPAYEISKIIHQNSGLFFCDIVQAIGKIKVDLEQLNVDFACLSAHKFNGLQGVGALFIRKGLNINPLIYGGKHQQGMRSGTINLAGIIALTQALKISQEKLDEFNKISILRDYLENEITKIANDNVKIFSRNCPRLANTSLIALANCDAQTQIINFDLFNICVSAGSACSSGTISQSRILQALNCEEKFINSAIRVSLGIENSKSDIEKFIQVWHNFYQHKFKQQ